MVFSSTCTRHRRQVGCAGGCWQATTASSGRGLTAYPGAEACRAGLERTLLELPSLVPAVMRVDHCHWGWRLRAGVLDVVGSGHPYDRRPRCEAACTRFVELAPAAAVRDAVTVMPYGRRDIRPSVQRPSEKDEPPTLPTDGRCPTPSGSVSDHLLGRVG